MDIREYAKNSKIPLKTLLWMEKIKIVSDPLIDNERIGLELIEKVWGRHDFIRPQLRQKNITYRKALISTCTLNTKWERYAYSRFMNMEPGQWLLMKNLIPEIEITFRFKLSDSQIIQLYRVRKRAHRTKERQAQNLQNDQEKDATKH
ncbi:MAG: hypothetical protein KJ900_13675 [Proteobacteria bacterium]|jgi:hypothetical protein|nr:hypothetical protein [Desulfocapsa sp.]MBU3945487.1 hypothetical protein [Pseudomonadota bacterium]MCG2745123.1 hypothetical protein [Desulfobacteraceae bacterium]MBU4029198.1 hypothetical protein [Pseudomonadota bacterium]MBU4043927.1 hypothetical protein [Pseudomonadota bacterium]